MKRSDMLESLFPRWRLSGADWVLAAVSLGVCFVLFYHGDLYVTGFSALNYLYGSPLAFYENSKVFVGDGTSMLGTGYLPPIYVLFALVLFPLKALGVITGPEQFSWEGIYLLKAFLTAVYLISGYVFYRLTGFYSDNQAWRKYATAVFLTSPMVIFTQFIFSQIEIIYVVLTMVGFCLILKRQVLRAALVFSLAITFKSFPALVFLPLLLLVEKRFLQLAAAALILVLPTLGLQMMYGGSPAFVEGVLNNGAQGRIYVAGVDLGAWRILFFFAAFSVLCGWSYLSTAAPGRLPGRAAYVFLAGSILPLLFVNWHPQWLMFVMPAIVLTSMVDARWEKFLVLDLAGMAFFVAATVTFFRNIEHQMLRLPGPGWSETNGRSMELLFAQFGDNSASVYASLLWGYLVLQLVTKARPSPLTDMAREANGMTNGPLRLRLYGGLALFLVPLGATMLLGRVLPAKNNLSDAHEVFPGELTADRVFEQTITGTAGELRRVSLLLGTYQRRNTGTLNLELIDDTGAVVAGSRVDASQLRDNAWRDFSFDGVRLEQGAAYKVRLTSPDSAETDAITWWASRQSRYSGGEARVDGRPFAGDFTLRLEIDDLEPDGKENRQ
jgi:hypothetical protein